MSTRTRCVLLDANVVIAVHELGVWDQLIARCEVFAPETVVEESRFHSRDLVGFSEPIDLRGAAAAGRISILSASAADVVSLQRRFAPWFLELVHPGELEAIALLLAGNCAEMCFCTGDGGAIRAATLLGLAERCVALDRLLESTGLSKKVRREFTSAFLEHMREEAREDRITGRGLRQG